MTGYRELGRFARALRATRSLLGGSSRAPSAHGPYVQGVTASSAVICWVSEGPEAGVVEYGESPELERGGYEVSYREFEGGHEIPPHIALEAVGRFAR